MKYSEQLKDPRWQKKRLEVLQRQNFTCEGCSDSKSTLHVHHKYYVSHRFLWEYPPFCYQVLCVTCHDGIKTSIEEHRHQIESGEGGVIFDEWEFGLNHFGDSIFDMAANECISKENN